jgi:5'-3' exonuclease
MSKITANVQKFFDALLSSGLVNKKNAEQLPLLWANAHVGRPCPALVEKSKDETRIGKPCGRPCMTREDTCLCHLPKEKRDVFSEKAKQTRRDNSELKKKKQENEPTEQKQAKEKKVKEQKVKEEKVKQPKEEKVKQPKEEKVKQPMEEKVKQPKEPKEEKCKQPKEKKVKEPIEKNKEDSIVENHNASETVEHTVAAVETVNTFVTVEEIASKMTGTCIGTLKSGHQCMNNTVKGLGLCKKHSK